MSTSRLKVDLAPLRSSPGFRAIYASRTITWLGTSATEVGLLVEARQLTQSALAVGLLGAAEVVPLVISGLYGGVLADRADRRRLMRLAEAGLCCCALLLTLNAAAPRPALWPLYGVAAAMMSIAALQRPSLDASIPRIVAPEQLTAASALMSGSQNISVITGTALGGLLAVHPGVQAVYALDVASFLLSLGFLARLRPLPAPAVSESQRAPGFRAVLQGLSYARGRTDLLGSYLVDLGAMTLAYPNALFPFMAASLHASWAVGLMFAAPSAGAVAVTATGGWMSRVRRHGLAIAVAAASWGLAITGFALAPDLAAALAFLTVAGAADMTSGIFRDTLWNQTIPDSLRGRMAGVELLSYGVGPSVGQIRAGAVASLTTPRFSLVSGGVMCVLAVGVTCQVFPALVRYRRSEPLSQRTEAESQSGETGGSLADV
ncbi:MAG TPA: MFS transporter [Streptosporangiaceae bacterium]|nr:MFS transporter [Streptosporangiaceae bacterium]